MEQELNEVEPFWYVLRDLKRPNAKKPAWQLLQEDRYQLKDKLFIPMKQRVYTRQGKKVVRLVPFMTDLIFVHENREVLDPIVRSIELLQYRFMKGGKQHDPMKVPHAEMSRFIEAVNRSDNVEYYSPEEVSPRLYGKEIRIIGGQLNGYEGRLLSKRGSRCKRILIELEGFFSAGIEVEPEYIQLLKK